MRTKSHITFVTEIDLAEKLFTDINLKADLSDKLQDVDLFTDSKEYKKLTTNLTELNIQYDELFTKLYSKDELLKEKYLKIRSTVPWGYIENSERLYAPETICPKCGNGGTQTSSAKLKKEPKIKYADILYPTGIGSILFFRESILEEMEHQNFDGYKILPLIHSSKGTKIAGWKQVVPINILPSMSDKTNIPLVEEDTELLAEFGLSPIPRCRCGKSGFNVPDNIIYEIKDIKNFYDFNLSSEWFGGGTTQPVFIISVNVFKFLIDKVKYQHLHFEPIYFK